MAASVVKEISLVITPESLRLGPTPENASVIPTTLARGLDLVAVSNCLRIMEVLSLAIAVSGSDEE
jgi:hypothetical protein